MQPANSDALSTAMLVTDRNGNIVMADGNGARLLALADDGTGLCNDASIPAWLAPILADVRTRAFREPSSAPQIERHNRFGNFVFSVHRLESARGPTRSALFAISIEHRAPLAKTIGDAADRSGLSARQRQVCIEMLSGASYAEIGCTLGIKQSTVVDHVRRIYEKLAVHSREELAKKLL